MKGNKAIEIMNSRHLTRNFELAEWTTAIQSVDIPYIKAYQQICKIDRNEMGTFNHLIFI